MKHTRLLLFFALAACAFAQQTPRYDLILHGGHVIDAKNNISAVRDVAIANGTIAAVAARIDPAEAVRTVDVTGLYVTPGLIDIHTHVFYNGEYGEYAGDHSVQPDAFTFRVGVTTIADAGCSGWRTFEDFKSHVIDKQQTRVLAFLNIVGNGMRGGRYEQDINDMDPDQAAAMALKHKDVIIGIKTAHFNAPTWTAVEHAVEAGTKANIPVMVDFGNDHPERPLEQLVTEKLRPGDIYTHCYSGLRRELVDGHVNPGMVAGRKRGVIFDVGHGGGSFAWRVAIPALKDGFLPDSISTDLHVDSMNAGMKDMLNVMSKFLAMGLTVDQVIARSTWNPAREIHQDQLGNLSVGAPADVTVLRVLTGKFGYTDMYGARLDGNQKFQAEITIRNGKVVYDLNGLAAPIWTTLPADYGETGDRRWDAVNPAPAPRRARSRTQQQKQ